VHGRGASAIGVVDNKEGVDESLEGKRRRGRSGPSKIRLTGGGLELG